MKALTLLLLAASLLPAVAQQNLKREAAALAFLKEHAPEIHTDVRSLRRAYPADYRSIINDAAEAAEDYRKLQAEGDTKTAAARLSMYKIDYEAIGLSDEIVQSTDATKIAGMKKKLQELISASFDQWVIVEAARIRRLEKNLAALKADYADTLKNRDRTIKGDTDTLIMESRAYLNSKKKNRR